ncbi:MAG: hypothetical protein LBE82_04600 [Chitinophagaceae bacterium]|jgi:asparagine synthase (glutamine-hydrolysing)|nr:hypothetical protein [Chitinophagaceae bacterium]
MPGLFGYTKNTHCNDESIVIEMRRLFTHNSFHIADEIFSNDDIAASRVHINVIQKEKQPHTQNGIYIWLDGEFYNQPDLLKNSECIGDAALLQQLYCEDNSLDFLKKIDGIFIAVIYDSIKKKLHLISDRHGLRQIFWTNINNAFFWFSEIKAVLAIRNFPLIIEQDAINSFLTKEYLTGDSAWFKNVFLLNPATVLTWDISSQKVTQQQYWSWNNIAPVAGIVNEKDMIEELAYLFKNAVAKRADAGRIGITLSGGLDSRALLAALPSGINPVCATFGKENCDDIQIAKMVAKKKNTRQVIFELTGEKWITSCFKSVWATDGQSKLTDMHGTAFAADFRQLFDVNLSGFLGDAFFGGGYFRLIQSTLLNVYLNRGRRRILMFVKSFDNFIHNRLPFLDNDLMNFFIKYINYPKIESGAIYHKMLLQQFPEYYKKIPWQETGLPINASAGRLFLKRVENKIGRELPFLPIQNNNKDYCDYPLWASTEPAKSVFIKLLTNPDNLYQNYLDKNIVLNKLNMFMSKPEQDTNYGIINYLSRILTIEIWLQQFFNNKYREGFVFDE